MSSTCEHTTSLADCGAGIGRVTKHFLLPLFQKVDMVEQDKTFVDQAPAFLVNIFANPSQECLV